MPHACSMVHRQKINMTKHQAQMDALSMESVLSGELMAGFKKKRLIAAAFMVASCRLLTRGKLER